MCHFRTAAQRALARELSLSSRVSVVGRVNRSTRRRRCSQSRPKQVMFIQRAKLAAGDNNEIRDRSAA